MAKLKVAIIGAGQIAQVSHIKNYQNHEAVEVVAICDSNKDLVAKVAGDHHIAAFFTQTEQMLETIKPDAVSICVPNKFHASLTLEALNHNCHVLCEKPAALSWQEAQSMADVAKSKNRILTFGFHFRYHPHVAILKEQLMSNQLGEIYGASVKWIRRRGIPGWGSFTRKEIQGGGPLIDLGAHMLDVLCFLLDYPSIKYICAGSSDRIGKQGGMGLMGNWQGGDAYSVEDGLFGFVQMENNLTLQIVTAFALHTKEENEREVSVYGDRQGARLFPLEVFSETNGILGNQSYQVPGDVDMHKKEIHAFVEACLAGVVPTSSFLPTGEQGVYVQKMLDGLYLSAEKKEPIWFKDI